MEENLISPSPDLITPIPDYKLYKDRSVYVGTILGGPLVAGYLAAENFKQLGQPEKVKNAWFIAIIATLVLLGIAFFIPGIQKTPGYIIPLLYSGIAQYLIQRFQGNAIKEHIQQGGQVYSVWRAVWIGLVGLVILAVVVVALILATDRNFFQELSQ
jgi:hypothetical protein